MFLNSIERWARRVGLVAVLVALATLLWGVWRGMRRSVGRKTGREPTLLRQPVFYLLASAGYFGLCYRLWRPLWQALSLPLRVVALILGSLLYLPGLALVLWGRLALGQMYNVSSTFGARLYADHRLVTSGPFAYVRHPMYLGILLTGLGGLLLYRTWTFVFLIAHFPALMIRARREEQVLAAEFGQQWEAYRRCVPTWLPRYWRNGRDLALSTALCTSLGRGAMPSKPLSPTNSDSIARSSSGSH
jgi:protein-S-isoprenylcysteine O-methyltransferase Ste14